MNKKTLSSTALVAAALAMSAAPVALAGDNDTLFRIESLDASTNTLSVFEVTFGDGVQSGNSWTWEWDGGTYMFGNDDSLGGFSSAAIEVSFDSRGFVSTVNLGFDVFAGAGLTAFSIGSGPLALAPVNAVQGIASASVGVTDVLGGGAELAPDGAGMYRAFTNGSDTFTNLLGSSLVAGDFSSAQTDDNFGLAAIAGPVSEIAAEWNFTLTAFDTAAGTSTFSITPAPGAVSLLGFAGLVATRRRR
ncbi:MAG: hypothetical protein ACIARR_03410 [Phycisphaerales bacterium JB059]